MTNRCVTIKTKFLGGGSHRVGDKWVGFLVRKSLFIKFEPKFRSGNQPVCVLGSNFIGPSGKGATVKMQVIVTQPIVRVFGKGLATEFKTKMMGKVLSTQGYFKFYSFIPNPQSLFSVI